MKTGKTSLTLLLMVSALSAAFAGQKIRTFRDIPSVPGDVLERTISATLHKDLLVSPVEGWIAVRGRLSGTRLYGARVAHSALGGAYDKYALDLARNVRIAGYFSTGSLDPTASVVLNVLIYQIADGTMALSFPYFDGPGGNQFEYYGATRLAVQEGNGGWRELKLPKGPEGDLWTVRDGIANRYDLAMKLNQIKSR
ncbi:MAG: hypothetical protein ACR2MW_11965 [Chthoniobacterales bacterium]